MAIQLFGLLLLVRVTLIGKFKQSLNFVKFPNFARQTNH